MNLIEQREQFTLIINEGLYQASYIMHVLIHLMLKVKNQFKRQTKIYVQNHKKQKKFLQLCLFILLYIEADRQRQ